MNVDHIVLGGDTLSAKINELEYLSADYAHIVWQCLPALLSYFSARVKNVCWWSFKFNPPITGLEHCITSLPENVDKKEINGNVWVNFTPQFKLKNRTRSKGPWQERRGRIAAFCREELIDEEKYWSFLSKLLKANKSFSFEYCGRREIHSKWTNRFSINPNQVRFLGWLKNPEINIREVAVLLDTYGLRHGLMAYEAAVVGVPIAIPTLSESFGGSQSFGGIQGVYERLGIDAKEFLSPAFGSFGSEEEGVAMLSKLALEEHYNNALGDKQQCLFKQLPFKGFDALTEILQGSEG